MKRMIRLFVTAALVAVLMPSIPVQAESAEVINAKVTDTISTFKEDVNGADVILAQASGYLVFPRVIKIGIAIGGETGEGVLRIGDRNVAYYRTMAGSFGLQLGAQAKSIIIAFMTPESLEKFRNSSGWKVGVDGSVALGFPGIGLSKSIDSHNIKDPVVGFIFGSKGLMYNLTLEGTKITKFEK